MSHVYKNLDVTQAEEMLTALNKIKQTGFFTTGFLRAFDKLMCTLYFRENSDIPERMVKTTFHGLM